mgnify:CR=1 FL=1
MQKIEARKMLRDFTVGDYPKLKSEDRSKIHRNTFKVGYPNAMKERAVKSSDLKGIVDIASLVGKNKWAKS